MATNWKFANHAVSRLSTSINATATQLQLDAGTGHRFPENGDFMVVLEDRAAGLYEIVMVGDRSGVSLLDCARGREGSGAKAWPAGTPVSLRVTARVYDEIQAAVAGVAGDYVPKKGGTFSAHVEKVQIDGNGLKVTGPFEATGVSTLKTTTTQTLTTTGNVEIRTAQIALLNSSGSEIAKIGTAGNLFAQNITAQNGNLFVNASGNNDNPLVGWANQNGVVDVRLLWAHNAATNADKVLKVQYSTSGGNLRTVARFEDNDGTNMPHENSVATREKGDARWVQLENRWVSGGAPVAVLQHRVGSGGGATASGNWAVRPLTGAIRNLGGYANLNSGNNSFTVSADGWVEWEFVYFNSGRVTTRLARGTGPAAATEHLGTTITTSGSAGLHSTGCGFVSKNTTYTIQHWATESDSDGMGQQHGDHGEGNIYGYVKLWRLKAD